eukprot:ANDGO_05064.mRNA.1 hypothetical protein
MGASDSRLSNSNGTVMGQESTMMFSPSSSSPSLLVLSNSRTNELGEEGSGMDDRDAVVKHWRHIEQSAVSISVLRDRFVEMEKENKDLREQVKRLNELLSDTQAELEQARLASSSYSTPATTPMHGNAISLGPGSSLVSLMNNADVRVHPPGYNNNNGSGMFFSSNAGMGAGTGTGTGMGTSTSPRNMNGSMNMSMNMMNTSGSGRYGSGTGSRSLSLEPVSNIHMQTFTDRLANAVPVVPISEPYVIRYEYMVEGSLGSIPLESLMDMEQAVSDVVSRMHRGGPGSGAGTASVLAPDSSGTVVLSSNAATSSVLFDRVEVYSGSKSDHCLSREMFPRFLFVRKTGRVDTANLRKRIASWESRIPVFVIVLHPARFTSTSSQASQWLRESYVAEDLADLSVIILDAVFTNSTLQLMKPLPQNDNCIKSMARYACEHSRNPIIKDISGYL